MPTIEPKAREMVVMAAPRDQEIHARVIDHQLCMI
jgi:hypothetical protein